MTAPPDLPPKAQNSVLTNVYSAYTLHEHGQDTNNEVEKIMLKNFLVTLAEVAMTIASRKAHEIKGGNTG